MKVGTVGTNFIVDWFIEGAKKTGEIEIAAVYSRGKESAGAFAEKHGVKKIYTERRSFLEDANLDFIYVASPNSLHYEWCRDALEAGRNVICEKPFVSKTSELEDLVRRAKEKNLFLFEAMSVSHLPNFALIREKLPLLGKIRFVQLNFSQYSSRYDAFLQGKNPNTFNPEFSAGTLMDLNCYNLHFVLNLFGEPESLHYYANKAENGIDTSGVLVMQYGDFIATAVAAKDSGGKSSVQIQGENGYIVSESTSNNLKNGLSIVTKSGTEFINNQDDENHLYSVARAFLACFRSGDISGCHKALKLSLMAARLLDMARKDAGIVFPADKLNY
ncbi:MAG: Gfo/Idh/MocA family oxidoreductase [Spirochaetales bacterium]|jgi:predicted dehydrogenase|nr:Gfo/Idh/MocA family oxidoreductase [Spirochaetales bacterium]